MRFFNVQNQKSVILKAILPVLFILKTTSIFCQASLFDSLEIAHRSEVYFEFGKSDLNPAADTAISVFSDFLIKIKRLHQIRLTAHTDSIGGTKANLILSQKRVESVRNRLIYNGLDGEKISFRFFGETQPLAENATEAGRQVNRRATLDALLLKKMATVEGQVLDEKTGRGLEATVVFRTKTAADSVQTDSSGKFSVRLPEGQVVGVEAVAKGHFFESQTFKVLPSTPMLLMKLSQVEAGAILPIKNLYFVGNEATLLPTSVPTLNALVKFMRHNPGLKIEIAGHVNMPFQNTKPASPTNLNGRNAQQLENWSEDRLMKLSVERAKTVLLFLKKNGIAPEQMTFKGYSNKEMAYPYAKTEAEQAANRRVEIRVLSMGAEK